MNMNKSLAVVQEQWNQKILFPYVEQHQEHMLSRPF